MNTAVIIPARYGSTRLPAKALKPIGSKTLIRHVWERALQAKIGPVYVATDHAAIKQEVESWGGQVLMTSSNCATGSDRVAQALEQLPEVDTVVNVQGDLPFVDACVLKQVLAPLEHGFEVATLVAPMPLHKKQDPNTVKAIVSGLGSGQEDRSQLSTKVLSMVRCHWFCRAPLPYGVFHFGVYAYQRSALLAFRKTCQSEAEKLESLEQLRFLSMGFSIGAMAVDAVPFEVNTAKDYEEALALNPE